MSRVEVRPQGIFKELPADEPTEALQALVEVGGGASGDATSIPGTDRVVVVAELQTVNTSRASARTPGPEQVSTGRCRRGGWDPGPRGRTRRPCGTPRRRRG